MDLKKVLKDGMFRNSPIFIQLIDLCSTLAVANTLLNSLTIGITVTFVLIIGNTVVSALRKIIPSKVWIPTFIVVIATFVALVKMVLHTYVPLIYEALGIFLPLIAISYYILGETEGFAHQNRIIPPFIDGLGAGLGYTITVLAMGFVCELFGSGELFGTRIFPEAHPDISFLVAPASVFVLLGFLIATFHYLMGKKKEAWGEEMLNSIFIILIGTVLINNYVFAQFLGICPFLGVSSRVEASVGMSIAITFVVVFASVTTWVLQKFILGVLSLEYLQTIVFILVIASLVQLVEIVTKKMGPALYTAMGVYLPLITINCVALGVTVPNIQNDHGFIETLFSGLGASVGFGLALVLIATLCKRLEIVDLPKPLQGVPIALISAGLMAITFGDFAGLI